MFPLSQSLFLYKRNRNEHQKIKNETTILVLCLWIYAYDMKYDTPRKKEHDKYGWYTIDIKSITLTIL